MTRVIFGLRTTVIITVVTLVTGSLVLGITLGLLAGYFGKFIDSASKFFVDIEKAVHIGSLYTIRAVLPNRDHDDARPSLIAKHSNSLYSLFSGKISTCVDVANDLVRYVLVS